jgi:hypothetical protein
VNRTCYRILWVFEAIAVIAVAFLLTIPIQDYAMREFKEWHRHPSIETERAFRDKQRVEPLLRLTIAAPFAATALLLAIPLYRLRGKQQRPTLPAS